MFKHRWGNYSPPCALDSVIQAGMTVMQMFDKNKVFLSGNCWIDAKMHH
jgi:hypothetical protein